MSSGRRIGISTSTPAPPGSPVTIRASWDTAAISAFRWKLFVNDNRAALVQFDCQFGGKPQTARRLNADLRGAIAALAAKSAPNDEAVQTVLRIFGDLRRDLTYAGSARAGYAAEDDVPGAANRSGRLQPPLPLDEIAGPASIRMALALCFAELWQQSPTMLQPVGGMDAIVRAFDRALGGMIRHNEEVVQIDRIGEGARVISLDRSSGDGAPSTPIS